jgi:hypothetical protein
MLQVAQQEEGAGEARADDDQVVSLGHGADSIRDRVVAIDSSP